jgi:cytochrome c-type biogenesis protein
VLGAILTLAGTTDTIWSGMGLLLVYSIGLAIPFMLAAVALGHFLTAFKRFRHWIPILEKASGLLLVFLGILLLTGSFELLTSYLTRFTPDWILDRI